MKVRSTPTPLRDAADGDGPVQAAATHAHDRSLEDLDPLAGAFDHLDRHAHGIARGDLRDIGPELLALELLDGVHRDDLALAAGPRLIGVTCERDR